METFSDLYCSDVKRYKILKWGGGMSGYGCTFLEKVKLLTMGY